MLLQTGITDHWWQDFRIKLVLNKLLYILILPCLSRKRYYWQSMVSSASYDNIDRPHCTLVLWVQWLLLAELGYKYFRCSGHHTKTSWLVKSSPGIYQKRQLFGWYLPAHKRLKWFIKLHYSHFYASVFLIN